MVSDARFSERRWLAAAVNATDDSTSVLQNTECSLALPESGKPSRSRSSTSSPYTIFFTAMASLNQLETEINELLTAAKALVDHCRAAGGGLFAPASPSSTPRPAVPPEAPDDAHRARRNVLAIVTRLQMLLAEPADFIQHLACQVRHLSYFIPRSAKLCAVMSLCLTFVVQSQLLACLKWLGEFQVLACIPLSGTVPLQDVADLAGVPEGHLLSVVRMTATAGFLHEPQPGHVAHTALSAPFVTRLTYLDAAMFLAETAAPTALKLAAATKHHGRSDKPAASAYTIAFNTSQAFNSAYEQRPKLQRQWPAYLRCTGDMDEGITEILTRLAWPSLGNACVVDVSLRCLPYPSSSYMPAVLTATNTVIPYA